MGTAIKTNGEGKPCSSHLNLTVSLADLAHKPKDASQRRKHAWPRYERATKKIPYAGKEMGE